MRHPVRFMVIAALAAACGDDNNTRFTRSDAGATTDDVAAALDVPAADDVAQGPLDVGTIPLRDTGPGLDDVLVYAHTDTTLYSVNPRTNALTRVGDFRFPSGVTVGDMTDIAIDADGNITGTTSTTSRASGYVWRIDARTAACTRVVTLPGTENFVALSWVPRGVIDASAEVLVGGTMDGDLYRIDVTNGRATRLFTLPQASGQTWQISGDIVSVSGANYVTVRRTGTSTEDSLGVVDFTARTLRIVGTAGVGFPRVFGVGYWRQTLFGFTRAGEVIAIDARTGVGRRISMPSPTLAFAGAGVTTVVSIAEPP